MLPALLEPGYPRPLLRREGWSSLDGEWDFAMESSGCLTQPDQVTFDRRILVPFAPETERSGVGETGFHQVCWYRRTVAAPQLARGQHLLLHFGAVDYEAQVWVNG